MAAQGDGTTGGAQITHVGGEPPPADWRKYVRVGLWLVLAILTALLLLRNSQTVEVDLLFGTLDVPLFVALGLAIVLGALLAGSIAATSHWPYRAILLVAWMTQDGFGAGSKPVGPLMPI